MTGTIVITVIMGIVMIAISVYTINKAYSRKWEEQPDHEDMKG